MCGKKISLETIESSLWAPGEFSPAENEAFSTWTGPQAKGDSCGAELFAYPVYVQAEPVKDSVDTYSLYTLPIKEKVNIKVIL